MATVLAADATLLVHESFSGYTGVNINGQTAAGTGLTGSYASSGAFSYQASGLTFANIESSGGSLGISSTAVNVAGVQVGAVGTVTGDLFVSYLFNKPNSFSTDAASLVETRINSTISGAAASSYFRLQTNTDNASSNAGAIGYDSTPSAGASLTSNGITYLVLAKFTNVGTELSATTQGTATLWILTEAQYANLLSVGLSEANLNARTVGTTSTSVFVKISDTVTSGNYSFGEGSFLQFAATGVTDSNQNGRIDEVRIGTSLSDVTPIPEPSAAAALVAGLLVTGFRRRR